MDSHDKIRAIAQRDRQINSSLQGWNDLLSDFGPTGCWLTLGKKWSKNRSGPGESRASAELRDCAQSLGGRQADPNQWHEDEVLVING